MSDEMILVTADERERKHQEEAASVRAARRAGPMLYDRLGNPVSPEQVERELVAARAQQAQAAADFKANQRLREEEAREAARVQAEKDHAEMKAKAAQTKELQRANWIARGLDPDRFESAWPALELAIAQGAGEVSDAEFLAKKRREMGYG